MSRIVVTGGAGFIGSHLCEALLRDGHEVVAFDNFDDFYNPATKRRNLAQALTSRRFKLIEGDLRDPAKVSQLFDRPLDAVVHLAARAGVRPSIEQPLLYQDVNIRGTMVLLEACRKQGCMTVLADGEKQGVSVSRNRPVPETDSVFAAKNAVFARNDGHAPRKQPRCKLIFGSSSSVYGNNRKVPFAETDPVDDPISPYAATKKAGELLCYTYHHLYGLPVTCLRFFTVYGPRQRPDLAIHKFARLIQAGRAIPVYGDGSMMRDFTYIDDILDGIQRAIDRCAGYRIYNLGESQPVSLSDLIALLEQALGKKAIIERLPPQPGDVDRTFADLTLSRKELGYNPSTDLCAGLGKFVSWLQSEASLM